VRVGWSGVRARKSVVAFRNCANAPECNTFWPQVAFVFRTDL